MSRTTEDLISAGSMLAFDISKLVIGASILLAVISQALGIDLPRAVLGFLTRYFGKYWWRVAIAAVLGI